MSAVSTHGGGVRVWCSRFDRTRSNGNFVHLLPERLATSRIWSRCHEGFPSLQATGQKSAVARAWENERQLVARFCPIIRRRHRRQEGIDTV